jgi:hypothetical protein
VDFFIDVQTLGEEAVVSPVPGLIMALSYSLITIMQRLMSRQAFNLVVGRAHFYSVYGENVTTACQFPIQY